MEIFPEKTSSFRNLGPRKFVPSPKLGARSPPLLTNQWRAEAVGCPGPTRFLDALKNIFYSSRKISDDLFYQLSNFRTIRSLDAPSHAASCLGNDNFLFIFCHLPTFFYKNWPLGCPPGSMPGAVAPSATPSARHPNNTAIVYEIFHLNHLFYSIEAVASMLNCQSLTIQIHRY